MRSSPSEKAWQDPLVCVCYVTHLIDRAFVPFEPEHHTVRAPTKPPQTFLSFLVVSAKVCWETVVSRFLCSTIFFISCPLPVTCRPIVYKGGSCHFPRRQGRDLDRDYGRGSVARGGRFASLYVLFFSCSGEE